MGTNKPSAKEGKTKRQSGKAAQATRKAKAERIPAPSKNGSRSDARLPDEEFPIAVIGASAGGLEAFNALIGALPAHVRPAFVIIQHLSPSHESILPKILAKHTSVPVVEARDGMPLEGGNIYVMPANSTMTMESGRLRLVPRAGAARHMPIDAFLRSLAIDQPHRAIAIILSGAGSDGSMGLQEVKAAGGITFAQDEASAKFESMPHHATATGAVDFVLPPEAIAAELARVCRQFPRRLLAREKEIPSLEEEHLNAIYGKLRRATGVDFSLYKQTTVKRRIVRRMLLKKMESLGEYVELLKANPPEVLSLYQDMLIKVTSFFRDPEAFEALKKSVLPGILEKRGSDSPVRIWVPGCSTGEEVYSLAMVLLETLGDMTANTPIQIFATDISEEALAKARTGIYLENIAIDVSPERLRRFFIRMDGHYQISKHIRDMCIFARQDVALDHPFSRIDLISCRNLLIYLDTYLQKKVFPVFHYALKPTGYLMLGTSETIGSFSELFALVDKKHKIYAKKLVSSRLLLPLNRGPYPLERAEQPKRPAETAWSGSEVQKEADRVVLSAYSPPGVVVNGDMEILQFRGRTGPYLEPAPGHASLNLLKMVRPQLLLELRRTLDRARRDGAPARSKGLQLETDGKPQKLDIEAVPLAAAAGGADNYFLVLFQEQPVTLELPKAAKRAKGRQPGENGEARRLRKELDANKEYLQGIIEEHEATNEELKSANEEVLSSNEELQSINEELETAKEELQSSNEELTTLNEELQNRNLELNQVNNDMNNLLSSVNVPIVMLGNDLRIRRFTPMAEKILKLIPADVGRPLGDIKTHLGLGNLEEMVAGVIDSMSVKEAEVQDQAGHWYSLRIRPYRTSENKIDGAVLVFIDINSLRNGMSLLQEARSYSESIVETVRIPLLVVDPEGKIRSANRSYLDTLPPGRDDVRGASLIDLGYGGQPVPGLRELLKTVAATQDPVREMEMQLPTPTGTKILLLDIGPFHIDNDEKPYLLITFEEITARKRADGEIRRLNDSLNIHVRKLEATNLGLEREAVDRRRVEADLKNTVAELESFSYSVSHDLRAPLRAMQGVAEALVEDYQDKLDATGRDYLRRIADAARRLDALMQDLLAYNSMGRDNRAPQDCSLDQAVTEVLGHLAADIRERGAEIAVENPLGKVRGNLSLLDMVILNLVSNALKFVEPGHKPRVRIHSEKRDGKVRLWIEDNGIGIHPDHHQLIFRVFERLHGMEKYPGTGIGLAVVRKGVESLGGEVGLESELGRGSRFWIELAAGEKKKP